MHKLFDVRAGLPQQTRPRALACPDLHSSPAFLICHVRLQHKYMALATVDTNSLSAQYSTCVSAHSLLNHDLLTFEPP